MTKLRLFVLSFTLTLALLLPSLSPTPVRAMSCGACAVDAAEVWSQAYRACRDGGGSHIECRETACALQLMFVVTACVECVGIIPTCN